MGKVGARTRRWAGNPKLVTVGSTGGSAKRRSRRGVTVYRPGDEGFDKRAAGCTPILEIAESHEPKPYPIGGFIRKRWL